MATLTLELGNTRATIRINDADMTRIIGSVAAAYGSDAGTQAEQAQFALEQIGRYLAEVDTGHRGHVAAEAARREVAETARPVFERVTQANDRAQMD